RSSGLSRTNERDPFNPCSSLPHNPTKIVRLGLGRTFFKTRATSIIAIVPVPLSVAPEPPSHESRCADRITYSSGNSDPLISAMVLKDGTFPKCLDEVSTLIFGA